MARKKNLSRELIRLPGCEWSLREEGKELARFKVGNSVKMSTSNHPGVVKHTSIDGILFREDDDIFLVDLFEKIIPINMIESIEVTK